MISWHEGRLSVHRQKVPFLFIIIMSSISGMKNGIIASCWNSRKQIAVSVLLSPMCLEAAKLTWQPISSHYHCMASRIRSGQGNQDSLCFSFHSNLLFSIFFNFLQCVNNLYLNRKFYFKNYFLSALWPLVATFQPLYIVWDCVYWQWKILHLRVDLFFKQYIS